MKPFARFPSATLARLYRPASVLLVGHAQAAPLAAFRAGLAAGNFPGPITTISTDHLAVARTLGEPPPDLAIVAAEGEPGPILAALARLGVGGAVLPGPAPPEGPSPLPFLGGDSLGLIVPGRNLNASPLVPTPPAGPIALIGQSRGVLRTVIAYAAARNLGFAFIAGLGRNEGVGFASTLDWLTREPSVGVVLLEIERIRDRRGFLSALRSIARTRPVVAIRTAPDPRDRTTDLSPDQVFAAALRRAGALCVEGLEEMFAAVAALPRARGLRGERIAVIARSRALARLTERALAGHGLALARPPPAAVPALSTLLPAAQAAENPFVLPPGTPPTRQAELAAALAQLDLADAAIVVHVPERPGTAETVSAVAESLATAAGLTRRLPLLAVWPGETAAGVDRTRLEQAGIPSFPTPEEAAAAAALLVEHRRAREAARELPPRRVLGIEPDRAAVEALFAATRAEGRTALTEDEALALVAAYGIAVVPTRVAADPASAARAAAELGFPAVLKIRSPDLPRKTEAGGVVLDLADAHAVRRAGEEMLVRVRAAAPEARLEGFVVQRQAPLRGLQELQIRVGRDPLFGPAILFGAGGTKASVIGDVAAALPPLNLALARDLVSRTRISRVLQGLRDQPAIDLEALAEALVRVSQLVVDRPDLLALDINPLLAGPAGVIALDAGATIAPEPASGTAHLAIAPYPAEFEETVRLKDGRAVLIRPIRPEDAEAHLDFFRRLSPEDVRLRFFAPVSDLPPEQVVRLTQIDYDREMAFIGVAEGPGGMPETLGVVRIVREPGGEEGEFAVIVRSDLKGSGLGTLLMRKAIAWAKAAGLAAVVGEVLGENRPMLAFVQRLGFSLAPHPDDPELRIARLPLR